MIKVKKLCRLNGRQREEIRALEKRCKEHDNIKKRAYLSSDMNVLPNVKCFYLYYEDNSLLGFLSVYLPSEEEAHIFAIVDPSKRNKGIFKSMLNAVSKELDRSKIHTRYLVYEPSKALTDDAMRAVHGIYEYSEYLLAFSYEYYAVDTSDEKKERITLKEVTKKQELFVISLFEELFLFEKEEARVRFFDIYEDKACSSFVLELNDKPIGFCNVYHSLSSNTLFDIGIKKEYQGKGYGKKLVKQMIAKLEQEKKETGMSKDIILQVSSTNEKAFHLYKSIGFEIKEQLDYYRFLGGNNEE